MTEMKGRLPAKHIHRPVPRVIVQERAASGELVLNV